MKTVAAVMRAHRAPLSIETVELDPPERGERTPADWGLTKLRIGYGLSIRGAREWGLFLTEGRPRAKGWSEPPIACEP